MTSKKSGHENSGFKLLWQMVCVLLTAGCMLIRYVLLKGLGRATEEMPPACLVLAAALWVRRSRLWGREMASSPKILGRGEKCQRGGCREQREHPSFGQGGAESWRRCPKGKRGAGSCWRRHLEVAGPSFTDLSVRTPWTGESLFTNPLNLIPSFL